MKINHCNIINDFHGSATDGRYLIVDFEWAILVSQDGVKNFCNLQQNFAVKLSKNGKYLKQFQLIEAIKLNFYWGKSKMLKENSYKKLMSQGSICDQDRVV